MYSADSSVKQTLGAVARSSQCGTFIVKRCAEVLHATVSLTPTTTSTQFICTFPVEEVHGHADVSCELPIGDSDAASGDAIELVSLKYGIVDDEVSVQQGIEMRLEKFLNPLSVWCAPVEGLIAEDIVESVLLRGVDVVLVDQQLGPLSDGESVVKHLIAGKFKGLVIMCTGMMYDV